MTKEESIFRLKLGTLLRNMGFVFQPIESPLTGDGIPDAYLIVGQSIGWMELKVMRNKNIYTNQIPFRPGQYPWLCRNAKHGAFSAVAIDCDLGYVFARMGSITENWHLLEDDSNLIVQSLKVELPKIIEWIGGEDDI